MRGSRHGECPWPQLLILPEGSQAGLNRGAQARLVTLLSQASMHQGVASALGKKPSVCFSALFLLSCLCNLLPEGGGRFAFIRLSTVPASHEGVQPAVRTEPGSKAQGQPSHRGYTPGGQGLGSIHLQQWL